MKSQHVQHPGSWMRAVDSSQSVNFSFETEYLGNEGSGQTASLQILTWLDPSKRSVEEKVLRLIFFPKIFSIASFQAM